MLVKPNRLPASVLALVLWALLAGQVSSIEIQQVVDLIIEKEVTPEMTICQEGYEGLKDIARHYEKALRITEWPRDKVFAQSPDMFDVFTNIIASEAHNNLYLDGGMIRWKVSDTTRVNMDYSIHRCSESAQLALLYQAGRLWIASFLQL